MPILSPSRLTAHSKLPPRPWSDSMHEQAEDASGCKYSQKVGQSLERLLTEIASILRTQLWDVLHCFQSCRSVVLPCSQEKRASSHKSYDSGMHANRQPVFVPVDAHRVPLGHVLPPLQELPSAAFAEDLMYKRDRLNQASCVAESLIVLRERCTRLRGCWEFQSTSLPLA
mmetsp:Transcript_11186/g.25034  ORF Transcript_11186/g.25034 Transcript_11186/m.25034 type:complete len:171 (-) Transcript_11186:3-515(-)